MVKIIINIEGMMCKMCEAHTNDAIRNAFKVKKVESSAKDKQTVIVADNDISDDEIKELIYRGYDVQQIARAMRSDINLVAIKVSELNRQGCCFKEQEYRTDFLK